MSVHRLFNDPFCISAQTVNRAVAGYCDRESSYCVLVKGDAGRWRACKSSPTGQLDDPSVSPESRPRDREREGEREREGGGRERGVCCCCWLLLMLVVFFVCFLFLFFASVFLLLVVVVFSAHRIERRLTRSDRFYEHCTGPINRLSLRCFPGFMCGSNQPCSPTCFVRQYRKAHSCVLH